MSGRRASENAVLAISGLSKTYADGTRALEGITLTVQAGEILALVGGSGCGKTTLLRLIAGLDRASVGAISLDGEAITGPHPGVGLVFQEPRLLPAALVYVAVTVAARLHARVRSTRAWNRDETSRGPVDAGAGR